MLVPYVALDLYRNNGPLTPFTNDNFVNNEMLEQLLEWIHCWVSMVYWLMAMCSVGLPYNALLYALLHTWLHEWHTLLLAETLIALHCPPPAVGALPCWTLSVVLRAASAGTSFCPTPMFRRRRQHNDDTFCSDLLPGPLRFGRIETGLNLGQIRPIHSN